MMMSVDQEAAKKATQYLVDSAAETGAAKADVERTKYMLKCAIHLVFAQETGSVADRTAKAEISPSATDAAEAHFKAVEDYEKLRAMREAANAKIEYWRTSSANQRGAERGYGSAA